MSNNVLDSKQEIAIRDNAVYVESGNTIYSYEVVQTEKTKTDLSKYAVVISILSAPSSNDKTRNRNNSKKVEITAETLLYRLTSAKKIRLTKDVSYKRINLKELELWFNSSEAITIEGFNNIINAVHAILKRNYQFFDEVFETYDYLYLTSEFDVYKRSYRSEREICEKFYEIIDNKLKTHSLDEFISFFEQFDNLLTLDAVSGGKLCDKFINCAKNAIPHHFSRYVLAEYFTDNQIFDCYGGKEESIEYLNKSFQEDISDDDNVVDLLKKLTFDKENKKFSSKVYMEQLISTMANKGNKMYKGQDVEWTSYPDMVYQVVSKLIRLEKDKNL